MYISHLVARVQLIIAPQNNKHNTNNVMFLVALCEMLTTVLHIKQRELCKALNNFTILL